jgi:hypothetical protein
VNDFYPLVKRLLLDAGCIFIRNGKGDHEVWSSPFSDRPFTVDRRIKSRHTANAILKQAGLRKAF